MVSYVLCAGSPVLNLSYNWTLPLLPLNSRFLWRSPPFLWSCWGIPYFQTHFLSQLMVCIFHYFPNKKDGLYHIRWWVNTIKYLYIIFPCLLRPFSPHPPSGPCHSSDELGDQVPETRRPLLGRQQRSSERVATCPSYEADLPSKGHGDLEWINWT